MFDTVPETGTWERATEDDAVLAPPPTPTPSQ